jgi:cellulose synthase/poly-beta-1,6-N-acetylglucosamine synthase-like glycosyltransferase
MLEVVKFIFWFFLFLGSYVYFIYPLILWLLCSCIKRPVKKSQIFPKLSIIISVHNEEGIIGKKIKNTLELDYPKENLEVIVASDASCDKTNEIVGGFKDSGIKLLSLNQRNGKTFAQNEAAKIANGEIFVFSDATTIYEPQVLKKIVANFADPKVGAVGGELVYVDKNKTPIGEGNGLYWKYEKFLKKRESQISSLIGVSGCCYAVRKELYEPIRPDLISDFVIAQIIYKKGKRVVYEPEALSYEETNATPKEEFKMRVRVAVRSLYGLWCMKNLLNPFKYGFFSIQLISHKVMRYLIPIIFIILFLANVSLWAQTDFLLYRLSLYLQLLFYLTAFLGWFTNMKRTYLNLPFYLCVTNYALFIGLIQFLKGNRQVIWRPERK